MHTRLAAALTAAVLALSAAPALADAAPTPPAPTAAPEVVSAVESSLAQARTATPASKRSTCLAQQADAIAKARLTTGEWTYQASRIAAACKVLRVVPVQDFSASTPEDIAKRLTSADGIKKTLTNRFYSRHAASSYRLSAESQTATILLVAEPRHAAVFDQTSTRAINRAFVAARTAKPRITHSRCLSNAAYAWSKERVATAGATPGRRTAIGKACRLRATGLVLFETTASTKAIVKKMRSSSVFRSYAGRRTRVSFAAAVYADKISGRKQVIFLAGQPK